MRFLATSTITKNPLKFCADMEYLNKVELQGIVGTATIERVDKLYLARFSVMTEYAHRNYKGENIVEIMWWRVCAHCVPSSEIADTLNSLRKGDIVRLQGRLRKVIINGTDQNEVVAVPRSIKIVKHHNESN